MRIWNYLNAVWSEMFQMLFQGQCKQKVSIWDGQDASSENSAVDKKQFFWEGRNVELSERHDLRRTFQHSNFFFFFYQKYSQRSGMED